MDSGSRSSFLVGERVESLLQWGPAYLGERKNERTPMMGAFRKERSWRELRSTLICADVWLAASSSDQGFVSRRLSLRSSPPSLLPLSLLQHFWNAYEVPGAKALETGLSLRGIYVQHADADFQPGGGSAEEREKGFVLRFCLGGEGNSGRDSRCQACRCG